MEGLIVYVSKINKQKYTVNLILNNFWTILELGIDNKAMIIAKLSCVLG